MLTITSGQTEAFRQEREKQFEARLMGHLRTNHADAVSEIPDELLHQRVVAGIARARSYGLTWESSIGGFVALQFVIAPRFDEQPGIKRALTDSATPPDERVDKLRDTVNDADWTDASANTRFAEWADSK